MPTAETVSRVFNRLTPGPWRLKARGRGILVFAVYGQNDEHVAKVDGAENASVIIAAPDMLAALKRAVEVLDSEGIIFGNCDDEPLDVLSAARAAIEKAEAR